MNKLFRVIPAGAVLGLLAGLVLQLVEDWTVLTLPVRALGEGLRELSLSGAGGNLAAWGLVLLLSALPLILLLPRKGKWRGDEDWLLALTFPLLLAGLVLLVNPTFLSWADRTRFPVAVVLCLLSVGAAWGILKVLRRLEGAPREELARAFSLLLLLCAGLAACAAGFALAAQGLQRCQEVLQGNASSLPGWWAGVLGGGDGPKRVLSLAVIWAVCALEAAPGLLSAATMVWGAELARALGREDFDRGGGGAVRPHCPGLPHPGPGHGGPGGLRQPAPAPAAPPAPRRPPGPVPAPGVPGPLRRADAAVPVPPEGAGAPGGQRLHHLKIRN